jgi:hypothetical protein
MLSQKIILMAVSVVHRQSDTNYFVWVFLMEKIRILTFYDV